MYHISRIKVAIIVARMTTHIYIFGRTLHGMVQIWRARMMQCGRHVLWRRMTATATARAPIIGCGRIMVANIGERIMVVSRLIICKI